MRYFMTRAELMQQRQLLVALAQRLGKDAKELERETQGIHKLEGDYGAGEDLGDNQEIANQAMEEYLAQHMLGNQEYTLSEVEAALDRIKQGSYGKCAECHGDIGVERMKALPYARRCIQCAAEFHS
jgi:RNA polymerase-binding transcription factor DksA